MKRFSRMKSTAYSPVSTNIMGQSLIYNHMSHHYRRIYNAKSRVDCSPPQCSRQGQRAVASSCLNSCSDIRPDSMALVDELIYDTKLGPAVYCSQIKDWNCCTCKSASPGPQHNKATPVMRNKRPSQPVIVVDRHARCCDPPFSPFQPPVSKINAQSKLRDMKVYHPPRKKIQKNPAVVQQPQAPGQPGQIQAQVEAQGHPQALIQETIPSKEEWKPEDQVDDGISSASSAGPWIQMPLYMDYSRTSSDLKASSEKSSRDSAYNGGVSSGGESRGPTPEQIPGKPPAPPVHLTPAMEARLKRQKEEALYIQFIHEITQDVLNSGIFSNKGLRQVFQRHINLNKNKLDMERMKAEVARLQIQLDMLDDDEDTFPLPSKEDIVLGWPSPARDAEEQCLPPPPGVRSDSTLRDKLDCYCSEKSVKMKVVDSLIMSPSEVIQSLREMGFTRAMSEEICQSLSDKDLHLTSEVCRDMSAVLSSKEDIITSGSPRHKISADRISKGQTKDRPCLCANDEVNERRDSVEFTLASAAQRLKEVIEQFTGSPLSSRGESKQFEVDEGIVSPRLSKSSAERILREIIENFIECARSSRRDSEPIGILERRDSLMLSESSAKKFLRDVLEKLNRSSHTSLREPEEIDVREPEEIDGSERRHSSRFSVTSAARLLEEILAQFSDGPLSSQRQSQPLSVDERRDSKTFLERTSKENIQSPHSSPKLPRTPLGSTEQLKASSRSSSRESAKCVVGEANSKMLSGKRSPPSRSSSGSSKKLDLIQETAEYPDDNCKCSGYYRCCAPSYKSRISSTEESNITECEMFVSMENGSSSTFRTSSLGSSNQSACAENAEQLQGTNTSDNNAEGENTIRRPGSERSESLKISEARCSSISENDLEDEDELSVAEDDISTTEDISEELHSVKEGDGRGCSSSDSSMSTLAERLKDFTVDKDAFQPSSFPADKIDLVSREQLSKEHQS